MLSAQNTPVQKENAHNIQLALWDLATQASQGIAITTQSGALSQTPKTLTLRERAAAATARGDAQDTHHAPTRSPLDKYTPGTNMPRIQDAFPAALIANIDLTVLDGWFRNEGMKLLAIPFEDKAHDPVLRADIGNKILTAVAEITSSPKAAVAPPFPNSSVTKPKQMPITFLISHLTKPEYDILMSRHVWSSEAVTFRVIPTDPPCPDFLFTIRDLATLDETRILEMVRKVWNDEETMMFIFYEITVAKDKNKKEVEETLSHLIKSLKVTQLKIKDKSSALTLHFNMYTDGKSTTNEELWVKLRTYLASREYTLPLQGTGKVVKAPFVCGACHGVDHPRGLCQFPGIKG